MRKALVPVLCSLLWHLSAEAQTTYVPPPIRPSVDANGVELVTGTLQVNRTDITIGQPGAGGLTYGFSYAGIYLGIGRGQYTGTVTTENGTNTTYYIVAIDNYAEKFEKPSGGSITSSEGRGSTLSENAFNFIYTSAEGAVAIFSKSINKTDIVSGSVAASITSLATPEGEVRTYNYVSATHCLNGGCTFTETIKRLQSVTNNRGYQIKLLYQSNATTVPIDEPPNFYLSPWYSIIGATGINMAVDYCDPVASGCSGLTQTWPSVSYSFDGAAVVTDALNRTSRSFYQSYGGGSSLSIRWPGSQSDNVVYTFAPSEAPARQVTSVNRNGQTWSYSYSSTSTDLTTVVTDPGARTSTYVFDAATHAIKSYTNTAGEVTTYQNDSKGRPELVGLPSGQSYHYLYDARGNVTETRQQAAGSPDLVWSAGFDATCTQPKTCNKPNWTKDAAQNQTDYAYSPAHGNVTVVQLPAVLVNGVSIRPRTDYTYSQLQAYYKNSSGAFVAGSYIYYLTRVWQCRTTSGCTESSADALRTDIGYGNADVANNRLPVSTTVRDGAGTLSAVTTTEYDNVGNVIAVDGPLPGTVDRSVTRYDALGRVTWSVGPDQGIAGGPTYIGVHTTYDDQGRPTTVERGNLSAQDSSTWVNSAAVQSIVREFDADGRVTKTSQNGGSSTFALQQVSYDSLGRVDCAVTRMNPSIFGALPSSACVPGTAGVAPQAFGPDRITKYSYDAADRVTSVTSGYAVDPIAEQTMTYFPGGRLQTLSDGKGNKTTYSYDGYGRLYRVYYPDPGSVGTSSTSDYEAFSYDLNSQVTSTFTRSGVEIDTPRDALGRVTGRQVLGGAIAVENLSFSYDLQGRVLSALNPSSQGITQTYDALGRASTRSVFGKQLSYDYYLDGSRKQLTYPDGFYVKYAYTSGGQLQSIKDNNDVLLASYEYDGMGARKSLKRGATQIAPTGYTPDAIQRLQQLTQSATGLNLQASFAYNPAGQINTRTLTNDTHAWQPDIPNSAVTAVPDGQNQLTNFAGVDVTDDTDGNVKTGFNNLTYTYDALGELRQATGGANTVNVAYDPAGMLNSVTAGGATTEYVYDGADLIAQYDSTGLVRRFVHGPGSDEPLVVYDSAGNKTWLHADERGSIVASSNDTGALVSSVKYSDAGEASGTLVSPFGYTGQLYLPELQLYYYKARMYSPKAGRFLQPDPISYAGGMNLYAYVSGDPVNLVDPSGLEECRDLSGIAEDPSMPCVAVVAGCGVWCSAMSYADYVYLYAFGGGVDSSPGEQGGGGDSGPQSDQPKSLRDACTFDPLSDADNSAADAMTNDPRVRSAMTRAWQKTTATGLEHGFWIYQYGGSYHPGGMHVGTQSNMDQDFFLEYIRAEVNQTRLPLANLHTHPGAYPAAGQPSVGDAWVNGQSKTLGLILTQFGLRKGRTCH